MDLKAAHPSLYIRKIFRLSFAQDLDPVVIGVIDEVDSHSRVFVAYYAEFLVVVMHLIKVVLIETDSKMILVFSKRSYGCL